MLGFLRSSAGFLDLLNGSQRVRVQQCLSGRQTATSKGEMPGTVLVRQLTPGNVLTLLSLTASAQYHELCVLHTSLALPSPLPCPLGRQYLLGSLVSSIGAVDFRCVSGPLRISW